MCSIDGLKKGCVQRQKHMCSLSKIAGKREEVNGKIQVTILELKMVGNKAIAKDKVRLFENRTIGNLVFKKCRF